ncbi:TRM11 family methyltransferase [Polaromonas sp.]|uniref:TRM11 family SAM-dependent methyltransferase n=1 Tax=Polaromonas sp. TaxID=1869339 RepID=UPI00352B150B
MDLFDTPATPQNLDQWFTPAWAAEAIVDQEFGWLKDGDEVVEPSCGDGAFLCALPLGVNVLGVEIDPVMAEKARANSGRRVIVGNFLEVPIEDLGNPAAIIGNPPFNATLVAAFLDRSGEILREGGKAGLILPAYILQTSSKVEQLSTKFSIKQELLPRNLFPRLKLPLVFATFTKERHRRLFGFMLYREAQEIRAIDKCWKAVVTEGRDRRGAWYPVVREILAALGGEASLENVYMAIQSKRPTENCHWKAKVRQVLQNTSRFERTAPGRYSLAVRQVCA